MKALTGNETRIVDLQGHTILPGFIDAHGHIGQVAALSLFENVASPPVGPVTSIEDLKTRLDAYPVDRRNQTGGWILGLGYDDSLLAEQRHPTKFDLDAVSTEHPIVIMHVSLHLAVANSKALEQAGINAETEDPEGGIIHRVTGSREPDGVLEEHAMFRVFGSLPQADPEQQLDLLKNAQALYASNGITTAQEGASQPGDFANLRAAAAKGDLYLDVVAYPVWGSIDDMVGTDAVLGTYENRLKVGGVKVVLDGSPQGKTAYLSHPYHVAPPSQDADYRGYPAMPDEDVDRFIETFYSRGWQVLAHANGDAAADQLLNATEKAAAKYPSDDRRTVMIHAQTVRDDQLDRMALLGMIPSFFVAHTHFWGDWHRDSVLGPVRADRISPAHSAAERGITYTFHMDAPVLPPDILRLIWTGVNRITRTGDVLGPAERVSVMDAVKATTINAAYQLFEEDTKGSITPGKLADLIILSDNPLTVDAADIADIQVLETIKEGETVYQRAP